MAKLRTIDRVIKDMIAIIDNPDLDGREHFDLEEIKNKLTDLMHLSYWHRPETMHLVWNQLQNLVISQIIKDTKQHEGFSEFQFDVVSEFSGRCTETGVPIFDDEYEGDSYI